MRVQSAVACVGLAIISGCVHANSPGVRSGSGLAALAFAVDDPDANQPLQAAQVRLISERSDTLSRLTDRAGAWRLTISHLASTTCSFTVSDPSLSSAMS